MLWLAYLCATGGAGWPPGHFLLSEGIGLNLYASSGAPVKTALVLQDNFGSTLGLIVVLLAVLLLTYYATRFIAAKSGGLTKTASMRVKERVMLAKDKSVVLLETKNKYYLLGVTAQNVQLIAVIGRDELGELAAEEAPQQGAKGMVEAMGLFGSGKKGGFSFFAPRVKQAKKNAHEQEIDALLEQIQQRRNARYGAGGLKPEFREILKDSIEEGDSFSDDTKGDE